MSFNIIYFRKSFAGNPVWSCRSLFYEDSAGTGNHIGQIGVNFNEERGFGAASSVQGV